jgi:hypothetical protein
MHLLMWLATAVLIGAVYGVGQKLGGRKVGVTAAIMTALHPVVYSQALQLNLDTHLAAYAWLAIYFAACGRPALMTLALTAVTFTKLNGMFVLGPFMIYAFLGLILSDHRFRWQRWLSAFWPTLVPLLVFGCYTLIKWIETGHYFDTPGDFADGKQIALVSSLGQLYRHLIASWHQIFMGNGNNYILVLLLCCAVYLCFIALNKSHRERILHFLIPSNDSVDPSDNQGRKQFWCSLAPWQILILVWLMFGCLWSLQSIRHHLPLIRYFMVCYPALYLTLALLISLAFPRRKTIILILLLLFWVGLCWLKWHRSHTSTFASLFGEKNQARIEEFLSFPRLEWTTNFEINLQFIDEMDLARSAAKWIDQELPDAQSVAVSWPFPRLLTEPTFNIVNRPLEPVNYYKHPLTEPIPDVIVHRNFDYFKQPPESVSMAEGYTRAIVFQASGIWLQLYVLTELLNETPQ